MLTRIALFVALGSTAVAQTTTNTGSTTSGAISGLNSSSSPNSGFSNTQMEGAPEITGGGSTGASVNSSNHFGLYYANPYYPGRPGTNGTDAPGGFGTPLAGGSGGGNRNASSINSRASGSSGTAGRSTGATGSTGATTGSYGASNLGSASLTGTGASQSRTGTGSTGFGQTGRGTTGFGQTGTSGFGQTGRGTTSGFGQTGRGMSGSQNSSIIATQARPVSTTLTLPAAQFRPALPAVMHGEISTAVGRSSFISNPGNITFKYDGADVVLQGTVKDEEEARTAEGIVRLTPGVRGVKNELQFPKP